MKKNTFLLVFSLIILITVFSCTRKPNKALILKGETIIQHIPSASGVVYLDHKYWLIGDDASFLFEMDSLHHLLKKYQISSMNREKNGRIQKNIKPDFEALDVYENQLLILGSGSKKMNRDTAVIFNLETKKIEGKKNLRPLYEQFLFIAGFDSSQNINIEALASDQQYVYMMHRGNICGKNVIFQIAIDDWQNYWQTDIMPEIRTHFFHLPEIKDYLSGFSGACISPDQQFLLFTASVESTSDVYHDGEVLGSFIGTIPIQGKEAWQKQDSYLLIKNDSILKTKLESISIIKQQGNTYHLLCVSDNDNGDSGIYQIELNIKK